MPQQSVSTNSDSIRKSKKLRPKVTCTSGRAYEYERAGAKELAQKRASEVRYCPAGVCCFLGRASKLKSEELTMPTKRMPALMPRVTALRYASQTPNNMSRFECSEDERILLERQALSIFTECSNAGLPLRSSLVAILLSGIDWGVQSAKQQKEDAK
jgi:hypothetical protein